MGQSKTKLNSKRPTRKPRRIKQKYMRIETLLEVICATHLAHFIQSPYDHRGGLWLVGPPGQLKTTMLEVLDVYENALTLTDINTQSLDKLRSRMSGGVVDTLVIPDMQKLYERDPRTAANLEGNFRALVSEGYRGASYTDAGIRRFRASCTIIGAMSEDLVERYNTHWEATGFSRRFLWGLIRLQNEDLLMQAVENWKLADLGSIHIPPVPIADIPDMLTKAERKRLRAFIRYQPAPRTIPYQLICKIANVLRWHYKRTRRKKDAMNTMAEFALCLGREGANLTI